MKSKFYQGIQFKFFSIVVLSIIFATASITVFQLVIKAAYHITEEQLSNIENQYALFYFLAFLALTLFYYTLLSRKIIKRINKIYQAVTKMKSTDLSITIDDNSLDEIGYLARHINEMTKNLKKAKEREIKAEHEKIEIISSISHDLKTPLTSLLGYIELTKKQLTQDTEICYEYLDVAQKKCLDLKKQLNDLLEYCTLQFGGMKLKLETICATELVKEVLTDFIPEFERVNMTYRIDVKEQSLLMDVDPALFARVLQNIIANSIFYGKDGKRVDIKVWEENKKVNIKIINYGEKISEEALPYLFDRFYRGEKSRNENTGGKGMGLAIAKAIANLHEGDIKVESTKEETSFTITVKRQLHS